MNTIPYNCNAVGAVRFYDPQPEILSVYLARYRDGIASYHRFMATVKHLSETHPLLRVIDLEARLNVTKIGNIFDPTQTMNP